MEVRDLLKGAFRLAGLHVERLDPEVDRIPPDFHRSPFLPKVYMQTVGVVPYFASMLDSVAMVEGDIVECGVALGHSLLVLMLIEHAEGRSRKFFGFDSFEGFPTNTEEDRTSQGRFTVDGGDYAITRSIVLRTLRDGRVPEEAIDHLTLVKGFFEDTLPQYDGKIALLHLDCDLYESYKTCLKFNYDKVVKGGIIIFDEYEDATFPGAKRAIDEFFTDKPEALEEYRRFGCRKYYVRKL